MLLEKEMTKGQVFCYVSEVFAPFSVSIHKLKSMDVLRYANMGLGRNSIIASPASPFAEPQLITHKEGPTKLKHLCPPRAPLETSTSRSDRSQAG